MQDKTFGERLAIARKVLDITQDQLAERAGETAKRRAITISDIERGESVPEGSRIIALVMAMPEINPRWLLTGEGPVRTPDPSRAQLAVEEIEDVLRRMRDGAGAENTGPGAPTPDAGARARQISAEPLDGPAGKRRPGRRKGRSE